MLREDKSSWRMRIFSGGERHQHWAKSASSGKNKGPWGLASTLYPLLTTTVQGCPRTDWQAAQAGTALLVHKWLPSPWVVAGPDGDKLQEQHRQACEQKTSDYLINHLLVLTACWNDILATLSEKILKFISPVSCYFFFNVAPRQFKIIHVSGILFLLDGTGIENSGTFGDSVYDKGRGKMDIKSKWH